MFACSGNFSVSYSEPLRNPTQHFIRRLVSEHLNQSLLQESNTWEDFMNRVLSNNLIKIPDIYHVQMEFDSLLPNNFNSYIFNYLKNQDMHTTQRIRPLYTGGIFSTKGSETKSKDGNPNSVLSDFKDYI